MAVQYTAQLGVKELAMETATMGKVIVTAKIESLYDLFGVSQGLLKPEQVRSVEVTDALVDTGATNLSMPRCLIAQLGLQPFRTRKARTSAGAVTLQVYGTVRLTVQGRDCHCDVIELPDDCPVLIGQVPLELLDFVVDPVGQRLIGNPAHGGEHIIELY
jgi:predicted aspartyl protease